MFPRCLNLKTLRPLCTGKRSRFSGLSASKETGGYTTGSPSKYSRAMYTDVARLVHKKTRTRQNYLKYAHLPKFLKVKVYLAWASCGHTSTYFER